MSKKSVTRGWFAVGIGLIIAGGAVYGLFMILAGGYAIGTVVGSASAEAGVSLLAVLAVPGSIVLGFLVLLAKVVVDRLNNAEDDHYSKNVHK